MCRKIKKLAWYKDEDLLEPKLDYRFLELLVLFESKSDISDRLRKAGMTTKKYSDYFLDGLRPLLENPSKHLAMYLKKTFHPELEEERLSPELAELFRDVKKTTVKESEEELCGSPRPLYTKSSQMLRNESWTMVTPVPHIRCPCYQQRTFTPVVTEEERRAVEMEKTDLYYQLQTLGTRRDRELQDSLGHFLPNYQRGASREQPPPRPRSVPPMLEVPRGAGAFERLSTPRKRLPSQSPCHASACDAYRQGLATREGPGKAKGAAPKRAKKLPRRKAKQYREMPSDFTRLF